MRPWSRSTMRTNVIKPTGRFAPDFGDIRKNLMLKYRKYFVTLGFFVNISFVISQNFSRIQKSLTFLRCYKLTIKCDLNKLSPIFAGYIDVGDEYLRRFMLVTTLRCPLIGNVTHIRGKGHQHNDFATDILKLSST